VLVVLFIGLAAMFRRTAAIIGFAAMFHRTAASAASVRA
jgi:hypothetical protein